MAPLFLCGVFESFQNFMLMLKQTLDRQGMRTQSLVDFIPIPFVIVKTVTFPPLSEIIVIRI